MYTTRYFLTALTLMGLIGSQMGCKKKEDVDPTKGFSAKVQNIISQTDIDKLRTRGMTINEGLQPPSIEGIFAASPYELVSPYDGDSYKAGELFADLILRFSKQNSTDLSATVEIKQGGATANGIGGFLAGNGNKFTFFAEVDLVSGSATAKQIRIFSGEITSTGIKDFYTTLLMKSKNDPSNILIPVGTGRVLKDKDGLASSRSTFRVNGEITATRGRLSDSAQNR
jgi:hypothetical protein